MEANSAPCDAFNCAPLRDDGRSPALGEKLIEREIETALAAVGIDGRLRVVRRHQGLDGAGADALGPRLAGEFLLPGGKAGGRAAALGAAWAWGVEACEHGQGGAESKCEAEHGKAIPRESAANRHRLLARPRPPRFEGCGLFTVISFENGHDCGSFEPGDVPPRPLRVNFVPPLPHRFSNEWISHELAAYTCSGRSSCCSRCRLAR